MEMELETARAKPVAAFGCRAAFTHGNERREDSSHHVLNSPNLRGRRSLSKAARLVDLSCGLLFGVGASPLQRDSRGPPTVSNRVGFVWFAPMCGWDSRTRPVMSEK